jgi:hypothetical protein
MLVNGNLLLNALGLSEIKNAIIERVNTLPVFDTSEAGRIVFNLTDKSYYFNNGVSSNNGGWSIIAVGSGLANAIAEIDALEVSIGGLTNTDGTFNAAALSGTNYLTGATSITNAIALLDQNLTSHNTLAELDDVTLTSAAAGQFLVYDAGLSKWVNKSSTLTDLFDVTIATPVTKQVVYYSGTEFVNQTLVLTDVSDVTATAAELNEIHTSGAVLADYVKLHALTATAAELNQLAGASVSQADLIKLHALTATATELNYVDGVTSAIQDQLDNKQPLDADLTTLAGFAPAADSSETFTINGTEITHAGQNDVIVATGGAEGSRWTLKRGATARTSLGLGNIAIMDEASFIRSNGASSNVAQDVSWNNYKITNLASGTSATDAVNLSQLQAAQGGMDWKQEAEVATTANITLSGEQTIDGVAVTADMVVLVKNQTNATENGLYYVSTTAWVRTEDMDSGAEVNKATVFVKAGTAWGVTQWTQTGAVATLGTDNVTFVQTNALSGVTAGIGLMKDGNILNINLGAGIVELPSDNIGIDLYDPLTSAIVLTTTGSDRSDATNARLHLLLDLTANGKLVQSANGLKVDVNTITEAELTASVAGAGLTGGNGSALAVVSATGTAATGGDTPADWTGVGLVTVTADAVGVTLGNTSTTAAPGNHTHKAAAITFDNTATSLTGAPASVQAAIEAIDTTLDDVYADLANVKTAAGLNSTTGEFVAHTAATLASVNAATSLFAVDEALSAAITSQGTKIDTAYAIYTSTAASMTHVITHNCAQKYCLVTVVDNTTGSDTLDQVIIPHSIKYDSANQLTVTFNQAIDCVVIINGLTAARAV